MLSVTVSHAMISSLSAAGIRSVRSTSNSSSWNSWLPAQTQSTSGHSSVMAAALNSWWISSPFGYETMLIFTPGCSSSNLRQSLLISQSSSGDCISASLFIASDTQNVRVFVSPAVSVPAAGSCGWPVSAGFAQAARLSSSISASNIAIVLFICFIPLLFYFEQGAGTPVFNTVQIRTCYLLRRVIE